jgi:hypothetical protein
MAKNAQGAGLGCGVFRDETRYIVYCEMWRDVELPGCPTPQVTSEPQSLRV